MKKRSAVIILLLSMVMMLVFVISKSGQLSMEGNYYDNVTDFGVKKETDEEKISPLAQAYFRDITYEIIDMDKENMKATVKVSVPRVTDVLVEIVNQVLENNSEADAEQIKECVVRELQYELENNELSKTTETLVIPMERIFFEYNLKPGEEWYDFTMGQLEELYLEYFRLMIGELTNEIPDK